MDWRMKEMDESLDMVWIYKNTKLCPSCHTPISKNEGCNHMTCRKPGGCGYEFCWMCLANWKTHGSSTGGFYKCNIYEEEKSKKKKGVVLDKQEKEK
jgi:ariadne-1